MTYTLYIARERSASDGRFNMGSVLCLAIVKRLPQRLVTVQEVQACDRSEWLAGTPTLCSETQTWVGIEAFEHLLDLVSESTAKAPAHRTSPTTKTVDSEDAFASNGTVSEDKEEEDDDKKLTAQDMKMLER